MYILSDLSELMSIVPQKNLVQGMEILVSFEGNCESFEGNGKKIAMLSFDLRTSGL
jgi:hypothetical protein